jgi:hypothetical protein
MSDFEEAHDRRSYFSPLALFARHLGTAGFSERVNRALRTVVLNSTVFSAPAATSSR